MKKIILLSFLLIFTSLGCDIIKIKSKNSPLDNTSVITDNVSTVTDTVPTVTDTVPAVTDNVSAVTDNTSAIAKKDLTEGIPPPTSQNNNLSNEEKNADYQIIYQDNKTLEAIQLNTETITNIQSKIDNFSTEIKLSTSSIDNISMNMLKLDHKIYQLEEKQSVVTNLINKQKKYIMIAGAINLSILIIVVLLIVVINGNLKRIKKMIANGTHHHHKNKNISTENLDTGVEQITDNNKEKK